MPSRRRDRARHDGTAGAARRIAEHGGERARMKPPPFSDISDRRRSRRRWGAGSTENAKLLAGGQSLMAMLDTCATCFRMR